MIFETAATIAATAVASIAIVKGYGGARVRAAERKMEQRRKLMRSLGYDRTCSFDRDANELVYCWVKQIGTRVISVEEKKLFHMSKSEIFRRY